MEIFVWASAFRWASLRTSWMTGDCTRACRSQCLLFPNVLKCLLFVLVLKWISVIAASILFIQIVTISSWNTKECHKKNTKAFYKIWGEADSDFSRLFCHLLFIRDIQEYAHITAEAGTKIFISLLFPPEPCFDLVWGVFLFCPQSNSLARTRKVHTAFENSAPAERLGCRIYLHPAI